MNRTAIIISVSSDIGSAMARRWLQQGTKCLGTYRTWSPDVAGLANAGVILAACDLGEPDSIRTGAAALIRLSGGWDVVMVCAGTLDPVGAFLDVEFDAWENSVRVNYLGALHMVHALLPARRLGTRSGPSVLFFSGGATNNAPVNYSAYNTSKIGLIKMGELLAAEIPDTRFVVVGPGWVKTKIHQATLNAGHRAGAHYQRVVDRLARNECTPIDEVLDCCEWLLESPHDRVSGRNFSVVYDPWGSEELNARLDTNADMYKLRRFGNDWLVKRSA